MNLIPRISWKSLLLCGILFFGTQPALAEFSFSPSLLVREEYNDNIFLERDKKSDFITTIAPGFSLLWDTRVVDLTLSYGLTFRKYINHPEEDETSFNQTQRANLEATFHLYREVLFLRVSDVFERVPIDEGDKGGLDNELINLTNRNTLTINPYLQLRPWSTLGWRIGYAYINVWHQEDNTIDYERHSYSTTVDKELTGRISTYVTLSYDQYRPKDEVQTGAQEFQSDENDQKSAQVGFNYLASDRLSLSGYLGRTKIEYKENRSDNDSDIWGGSLSYQLAEDLSLSGGFSQIVGFSVNQGTVINRRYFASLSFQTRPSVTLAGFVGENTYLSDGRVDDVWGVSMGGDWRLTDKYGMDYLFSFTHFTQDDPTAVFEDRYRRYGARFGLYRDLRIGRLRFGYTYNKNDADLDIDDYDNNIVWAEMRFIF